MSKHNLGVYIGRFQPFHTGHSATVRQMCEECETVLLLVGSANTSRSPKNPFTFEERRDMIYSCFQTGWADKWIDRDIHIKPINDYIYDDNLWIQQVGEVVADVIEAEGLHHDSVAIYGYEKDESSFYLNFFKNWKFEHVNKFPLAGNSVDATTLRNFLFNKDWFILERCVPNPVEEYLRNWRLTLDYEDLKEDFEFVKNYKQSWSNTPYEVIFTTTDSVVVQSGHVLLIKRGGSPGKGQWALPGGFLNPSEWIEDCAIRELVEETSIKVPEKVLKGSIKAKEVFDAPNRSQRGRTVTHAFLIKLDDTEKLPRVRGSDDAAEARWIPLTEFSKMESEMYEDHFHIVNKMLSKI